MKREFLFFGSSIALMCSTAFSGVYIVCDDDGSNPVVTKNYVVSVFNEANKFLRQVAVTVGVIEKLP